MKTVRVVAVLQLLLCLSVAVVITSGAAAAAATAAATAADPEPPIQAPRKCAWGWGIQEYLGKDKDGKQKTLDDVECLPCPPGHGGYRPSMHGQGCSVCPQSHYSDKVANSG
jgi:hypothetical protein